MHILYLLENRVYVHAIAFVYFAVYGMYKIIHVCHGDDSAVEEIQCDMWAGSIKDG